MATPYAFVTSPFRNFVAVIDTSADALVDTIPTGNFPVGIASTPNGSQVCVACQGDGPSGGGVYSIDASALSITRIPVTEPGDAPSSVVFSPDGLVAFITMGGGNGVAAISTLSGRRLARVPVAGGPTVIAIAPDGQSLYVAAGLSLSLLQASESRGGVALSAPSSIQTFPFYVQSIVASASGSHVYVSGGQDATCLARVDTATQAVTQFGRAGLSTSTGMALTPDGARLYVSHADGTVSVFDTSTLQVVAGPIAVMPSNNQGLLELKGIAITPDGQKAYVGSYTANAVYVIDTTTNEIRGGSIPINGRPDFIAIGLHGVPQWRGPIHWIMHILGSGVVPPLHPAGPDPGPFDRERIARVIGAMSAEQRNAAMARLETVRRYLDTATQDLVKAGVSVKGPGV